MQEKFARLFDDAPQVPYSVVEKVFVSEFGRPPTGPDGIFEVFEEQAAASASIAQVHRAKLKTTDGSDQWVAVKIQKPDVSKQVNWDLGAFTAVMWMYEHWLFNLPAMFAVSECPFLTVSTGYLLIPFGQTSSTITSDGSSISSPKPATLWKPPPSSRRSHASQIASTSPKFTPSSRPRRS